MPKQPSTVSPAPLALPSSRPFAAPHTKHQLTRAANRDTILRAALGVFGTLGYGAATVRDIVRASGLAQGSFYNSFPDKAAVFQAVIDELLAPMTTQLRQSRRDAGTPAEFIHFSYQTALDMARKNIDLATLIAKNQTEFRQEFQRGQSHAQIVQDVENDLEAWVKQGKLAPHDTKHMADILVLLGLDLVVQVVTEPSTVEQRQAFVEWLFLSSVGR